MWHRYKVELQDSYFGERSPEKEEGLGIVKEERRKSQSQRTL